MTNKDRLCEFSCYKLMLLVLLVIPFGVIATEHNWTVNQLMLRLSEVSYAKLSFVETKHSMFLTTDLVIVGNIEYKAPGYLEKTTHSPTTEKLVVDGDIMIVEKAIETGKNIGVLQTKRYSIQSHPVLQAAVGGIRSVLAGNYEMLNKNYLMLLDGRRNSWTLELVPKSKEVLEYMSKITLTGEDARIRKYVTTQADGDESAVALVYEILREGNRK